MDRYMKLFVVFSVVYFFIGSLFGVLMATDFAFEGVLFAHIHLNLLGFMTMMIFGVGYFILPRFNARPLKWPTLMAVHFWLANITLVTMVVFYTISPILFRISSVLQLLSVSLFLVNIAFSILMPTEEKSAPTASTVVPPSIDGKMRVSELIERWPSLVKYFLRAGLKAFSDPDHLGNLKKLGVTLTMLAQRHDLDEKKLLEEIAAEVGGQVSEKAKKPNEDENWIVHKEDIIGDVLKVHPKTETVFRKFYGEGCFSCPGQAFETIAQSAMMHNINESEILEELNKAAKQNDEGGE